MRRTEGAAEYLDGPIDPRTLSGNLRDLARLNRWFGGVELSWRALLNVLRATSPGDGLSVLDVGTGAGDIPVELSRRSREMGRRVDFAATDVRSEIVAAASAAVSDGNITVRLAQPDLADERDQSFDVVHASLVLHHNDPAAARSVLVACARVSRSVVIVNDLDRRWIWWLGAWLLSRVATGNRYTRHDAPLSVRRAYTADELSELARSAGLREVARHYARVPYRYALTFVRQERA